jgi:hypothetical protein
VYAVLEPQQFYRDFPALTVANHSLTSAATPAQDNPSKPFYIYNCFAFVVGDKKKWWWPAGVGYWPPEGHAGVETVDELAHVLRVKFGYADCPTGDFERGRKKVAIFALNDVVTHVAVQPSNRRGIWKSKMGSNVDMEHDLHAIEGPCYGRVVRFMRLEG